MLTYTVRGVLAERGDNPALAAATAQELHAAWGAAGTFYSAIFSQCSDQESMHLALGQDIGLNIACPYTHAHTHTNKQIHTGQGEAVRGMIAALSRPTRIVRGKSVDPSWTVDPSKFELPEEVGGCAVCWMICRL